MNYFAVRFHVGGFFVRDPDLVYQGGYEHAKLRVDIDKWSYFEAIGILNEIGHGRGIRLWWKVDGPQSHEAIEL